MSPTSPDLECTSQITCHEPHCQTPDKEFQVFALELEGIGPLNTVKISSERLAQLQKATEQDPVRQTLKTTILMGWPTEREEVPVHIREF